MNAVISVIGVDKTGILALVSTKCAKYNANIIDVSQTVLSKTFSMVMMIEIDNLSIDFTDFVDIMVNVGNENNLKIHVMHENIFNAMHKV